MDGDQHQLDTTTAPVSARKILAHHLRISDVTERLGVAPCTIYRWIALGLFPKPERIGGRSVGWVEAQLVEYIERLNAR